jgi:hypothetical protein
MTLTKQQLMGAYVAAGAIGILIFAKLVFVPFHARLSGFDRDILFQEARLKKGISLVENKDAIEKEYAKFDNYFSLHGASSEEAVAAFLKEIEKVSRSAGMVILDVKPQKEPDEDKASRQYQINVKAESGMENLVKFLHGLYNSSLLFSVEKLVLVPKGDNATSLSISMTLVGVVFK